MNAKLLSLLTLTSGIIMAQTTSTIEVSDLKDTEKPIEVKTTESIQEENPFFKRITQKITFLNPNRRQMQGEFSFPIPDEGLVCGYRLEINGELIPGVVCEKEKARVTFENETRKGVDPGLVEHVKGNFWKTRIFPLLPQKERNAEIDYIAPKDDLKDEIVYEKDGDDIFVAKLAQNSQDKTIEEKIQTFQKGTILWDASASRAENCDLVKLETNLPDTGNWVLITFSNLPDAPQAFTDKNALITAIKSVTYDGGTDISAALSTTTGETLLFTDEIDTLSLDAPTLERPSLTIASRDNAKSRKIIVLKLTQEEKAALTITPKESTLLATVYAAYRMEDLASQSEAHSQEFLNLGRKYGVAGPGLSLIVLENLAQWIEHDIEPPKNLSFYSDWLKAHNAKDPQINEKELKIEHENRLLAYWKERIAYWNDPIPPNPTPKSGLFDGVSNDGRSVNAAFDDGEMAMGAAPVGLSSARMMSAPPPTRARMARASAEDSAPNILKSAPLPEGAAGSQTAPTVTLRAWDPALPYINTIKSAPKENRLEAYFNERKNYANSPAFFLDVANFFFKEGEEKIALRIISNLAEFRLDDIKLWRVMGWRLREAGAYKEAISAFRKALLLRPEEGQSRRDLAIVLMEYGKKERDVAALEEAMELFYKAAFIPTARRSARRENDLQVSIISLEELNGLIAWTEAQKWEKKPKTPDLDSAYRRDIPMKLRIVMSWDADETDIDLHVMEPKGEEAYYGHRRTSDGGFVSQDVTTGYGPEEYLRKELTKGKYKILSNYFASHQTTLTGATTITVTIYTDWATSKEKMQIMTLRLDKPKNKFLIGEVEL